MGGKGKKEKGKKRKGPLTPFTSLVSFFFQRCVFDVQIRWAPDDEVHLVSPLPLKRHSENFATELLLLSPLTTQASVSRLNQPRADRQKAILVRSNEHMVIMEVIISLSHSSIIVGPYLLLSTLLP